MVRTDSSCSRCETPLPGRLLDGLCEACLLRFSLGVGELPLEDDASGASIFALLDPSLPEGVRRFGDYELVEEIGVGGMGIVWRARQRSLNRVVAVKMIRAGQLARPEDVRRFRTEAEAVARLQHPGMVAIHEVGEVDGQHFFAMDLVEGPSLASVVRAGPLPSHRAATITWRLAEIVDHAHSRGVLHRDLKPSNILLDAGDRPRVTDFGLAKIAEVPSDLTQTNAIVGTPGYLAPEQAAGRSRTADARSDLHALGVIYELLTGRPPFQADTALATLKLVVETEPVPPRSLNPRIPRDLETICLKCLEKEPSRRYATAQDLAEDLERFLEGEAVLACPPNAAYRVQKWARRHQAASVAIALITVTVLLGVTVSTWALIRERRARENANQRLTAALGFVDEVFNQVTPEFSNLAGATKASEMLGQSGLRFVQQLQESSSDEPALRVALARLVLKVSQAQNPGGGNTVGDYSRGLQRAQEAFELLNVPTPGLDDAERLKLLCQADFAIAQCLLGLGRWDEAMARHGQQIALWKQLERLPKHNRLARREQANIRANMGYTAVLTGHSREALDFYLLPMLTNEWFLSVTNMSPGDELEVVANVHDNIACAYQFGDDLGRMVEPAAESVRFWQLLTNRFPRNARYQAGLPIARVRLGYAQLGTGSTNEGLATLQLSRDEVERLVIQDAANDQFLQARAVIAAIQAAAFAHWSDAGSASASERRRRLTLAAAYLAEAEEFTQTAKAKEPEVYLEAARKALVAAASKLKADERARPSP